MKETVLNILTNPAARAEDAVQDSLSQEYSAGEPWFDANER